MDPQWRIPAAIVVAGAFVAVATYLALVPAPGSIVAPEPNVSVAAAPQASPAVSPFAERERRRVWDEPNETSGPADPAPVSAPPTPASLAPAAAMVPGGPAMPAVSSELSQRVQADARQAFESVRASVRRDCWDALPQDPSAPASVELTVSLSFDTDGTVVASGVAESREASRDGVAPCVGAFAHALTIPAPPSTLSIQLPVTVP